MKKISFILLVVCMMTNPTATADIYHDGLRVLVDSGMNEQFSRQNIQQLMATEGKSEADLDKVVDKMVELIAPYFRQNFTEESFEQFLNFYTRPEMVEIQQKLAMVNSIAKNANHSNLIKAMMQIKNGQSPTDVFPIPCSSEYEDAFNRYWQMNNTEETLDYMLAILELSFAAQQNDDASQKNEQQRILRILSNYLKTNYRTSLRNSMLDIISVNDLQLYTSAIDQPFYQNQINTQNSLVADIPNFLTKVLQMMEDTEQPTTQRYTAEERKKLRWLSEIEALTFSKMPEDGQKFYASKVTTSLNESRVLCLEKPDTMVYFWEATINSTPVGVNADNVATVKRNGNYLTFSWTNPQRLFKEEIFRILDQNKVVKEQEVYYETDGVMRYNYLDHGVLVKTFRLKANGDTIAVWERGKGNQYTYTYNTNSYIQSVSEPDADGKQTWTIVYRESAGKKVTPPQLLNEYDLPTKMPGRLRSFNGMVSNSNISMNFSSSTICVYVMIGENGRRMGDYKMSVVDTKYSLSHPDHFSPYAHKDQLAYIKQKHEKLLIEAMRNYFKDTPLHFVPGSVDDKLAQLPCVFFINLEDGVIKAADKKVANTTHFSGPIYDLDILEQKPEFPGGLQALYRYVEKKVIQNYPQSCLESKTTGRAKCQFVVEPDGSLSSIEVITSSGSRPLDRLAISVIGDMPNWSPGMLNGQPVRTRYSMPIRFVLPKGHGG